MQAWSEVEQAPALAGLLHDRHHQAAGIDASVLAGARVLVAGGGALGNETLKNLALLGVGTMGAGTIGILDRDHVESGNLRRSVLYRQSDVGRAKATAAASRLGELNPFVRVQALPVDLTTSLGAGTIAGYDLVLGCLDSIEARWRLNRLCRTAGVAFLDAGIDAAAPGLGHAPSSAGQIAVFGAHTGACYECAMTESMWRRLAERRSCLLAGKQTRESSIASTAPLASLVAALQVLEAIEQLHRRHNPARPQTGSLLHEGDRLLVRLAPYSMTVLHSRPKADCLAHPPVWDRVMDVPCDPALTSADSLLQACGTTVLELDWDLIASLNCPVCGQAETLWQPLFMLDAASLPCPACGTLRRPEVGSRVELRSEAAQRSLAALGVPPRAWLQMTTAYGATMLCRLQDANGRGAL